MEGTGGGRSGWRRPGEYLTFRGTGTGSEPWRRTQAREDSPAAPAPVASLLAGELTAHPSAHPPPSQFPSTGQFGGLDGASQPNSAPNRKALGCSYAALPHFIGSITQMSKTEAEGLPLQEPQEAVSPGREAGCALQAKGFQWPQRRASDDCPAPGDIRGVRRVTEDID